MCGDFKIQVFLDTIARSRSLFWAWHNSAFMTGVHCTLARDNLDKVRARLVRLSLLAMRMDACCGMLCRLSGLGRVPFT